MVPIPIGTVKWFDCKKGIGFIVNPGGPDVMVHFSVIEGGGFRRLYANEKVEYDAALGPRGLQATRVWHINHSVNPGMAARPYCDGSRRAPIFPAICAEVVNLTRIPFRKKPH